MFRGTFLGRLCLLKIEKVKRQDATHGINLHTIGNSSDLLFSGRTLHTLSNCFHNIFMPYDCKGL